MRKVIIMADDFVFDYASKNDIYVRKWGDFESATTIASDLDFVKGKFNEYKLRTSDYLFGFEYDFNTPENAFDEYEMALTSFLKERDADRELLCSPKFKDLLKNYALIQGKDIAKL